MKEKKLEIRKEYKVKVEKERERERKTYEFCRGGALLPG